MRALSSFRFTDTHLKERGVEARTLQHAPHNAQIVRSCLPVC